MTRRQSYEVGDLAGIEPAVNAPTKPPRHSAPTHPIVFGIPVKGSKSYQLSVLAAGSLVSAVGFSTMQEQVFRIPGFKFGGWMTVITYVTYVLCASFERFLIGDQKLRSTYKHYASVSLVALAGLYLTNMSLNYLDYATRVIFKSSKVIPTMLAGVVILRRQYSWQQYCAGVLLVAGISLFTLGDKDMSPKFSTIGVGLISIALICDGATGNMEEKLFFRKQDPCTEAEVILYTSLFALMGGLIVVVATGELLPAASHSFNYIETVPYICLSSCLGYMSVSFILNLIKFFDATTAEIVKSLRKVLQVVMSFIVYSKPVNEKILAGGFLVAAALFWYQHCARSRKVPAAAASPRNEDGEEALPLCNDCPSPAPQASGVSGKPADP